MKVLQIWQCLTRIRDLKQTYANVYKCIVSFMSHRIFVLCLESYNLQLIR